MEKNKGNGDSKLIEHYFPVKEITPIALSEKKGRPPIFELHYWWTRKPLAAIRPTLLGAILPSDYDIRQYLKLCGIESGPKVNPSIKEIHPRTS